MRRIKPQLEKLQKQYPDKTEFQRKQMELQKKEGYSMFSSCLPSILTLVIFITLLVGLNNISAYMNFKEYDELYTVYNEAVTEFKGFDDADKSEYVDEVDYAQSMVYDYYQENKISWLWVNNIWSPDGPWKNEVNDLETFKTNIGDYGKDPAKSGLSSIEINDRNAMYPLVMGKLLKEENNGANGFLILPALSILLSIATQIITQKQQKQSGMTSDDSPSASSMKMMMWILPIMIGVFSLSYTSAFALYLVVNYLFSLIISLSSQLIVHLIDKREEKKLKTEVHHYGRPDPNDTNK